MTQEKKHFPPTNLFSFAPYGTRWIADLESGTQLWIQTSRKPDNPKWVRMGEFLETFYLHNMDSFDETLKTMLDLYTPSEK